MIGDYTDQEMQDIIARDLARAMSSALRTYALYRDMARSAERRGDTLGFASGYRSDARRALHRFPKLLALVERS